MTYVLCKRYIERTTFASQDQKDEFQVKLDVFWMNSRLTEANYNELTQMLVAKEIVA